jgi:uncharacterized protein YutE (UPF0331/DUF86 family)
MVLRADAVRERLLKLEEVIAHLLELAGAAPSGSETDFRAEWVAERGLQLGAELVFDLGNHVLSAHFGVSPQDYEDIPVQLGRCGVISAALCDRLKGLGGFRNILVHDYLRLDPARVAGHLRRAPVDFSDFATAVRAWLDTVAPPT